MLSLILRSSALITFKNDDKYCFIWSKLASLHPCDNDHSSSIYFIVNSLMN